MEFVATGKSLPIAHCGSHIHDTWEIILNLEGSGVMTVGNDVFDFSAGEVVCVPPGIPHIKTSSGIFVDIFVKLGGLNIMTDKCIRFTDSDSSVNHLISMMHSTYHRKEYNCECIILRLAEALEQVIIGKAGQKAIDPCTEHIISEIAERYNSSDFSVSDTLSALSYCEDHARRIFTRDMGMSPLEYLTDMRIRHAKRLLRENNRLHYTIAEIATSSGYSDITYFSRIFKKHTGMSPREYLKLHSIEKK